MAKAEKPLDSQPENVAERKKTGGRPPKGTDRMPLITRFFDRVHSIPSNDWLNKGGRAVIKVYRQEPISDRTQIGQGKMISVYGDGPIEEQGIKANHGSGKYLLYLNYQEPNHKQSTEIDSLSIEIWDPQAPPKMFEAEWIDDPKNKRWEWAKPFLMKPPAPPAPPASPSSMGEIVGAFQVFNEIQKTASQSATPPPTAPATDPMLGAMGIVEKILSIKADNPMVSVLEKMLLSSQEEARAQRDRVDKLLEKLSEKNNAPEPKTDPLTTIKSIFDTFKSVREQAADVMPSSGGRSRLGPWMEFFQPVLPGIVDMLKPVAVAIAQQGSQPNPAPRPQIQQTPAAHPPQEDFGAFLDLITPRMFHFMRDYEDPAPEFASWFHDGWGPTAQRAVDTMAAMGGVPALMNYYRASKHWPQISGIEPQFTKFLADVIAWRPETEEPETPPADATEQPVIDLEAEPAGAN